MCMEDIRIGRRKRAVEILVPCTAGVKNDLCGADPTRVAITLMSASVGTNTFSTHDPTVSQGGFCLAANGLPITLTIEKHGDIVTRKWYVNPATQAYARAVLTNLEDQ